MPKKTYVFVGKPLVFRRFELYSSPMGWLRIDILKNKIKDDINYRKKFTQNEIKLINRHFLHTHNSS